MGGAKSKLAENDWEKADGCLSEAHDTIDHASQPTTAYQTYELLKRSFNQREFDIIDMQKDLLYSTRAVPGTIACFDVLNNHNMVDATLRINVDISRRNWIVYSIGAPVFDGQRHDEDASEKFRLEWHELERHGDPQLLYRTAYITVSWSRYTCAAAHYGPPTPQMICEYERDLAARKSAVELAAESGAPDIDNDPLAQVGEACTSDQESSDDNPSVSNEEAPAETGDVADTTEEELEIPSSTTWPLAMPDKANVEGTDGDNVHASKSMPELADIEHNQGDGGVALTHSLSAPSFDLPTDSEWLKTAAIDSTRHVTQWVRAQSQSIQDTTKALLNNNNKPLHKHHHPMEGVVSLDRPLLLCQEIYTHFIGNHQTSLITKERALELLRQDAEMHIREHGQQESSESYKEDVMWCEESQTKLQVTSDADGDLQPTDQSVTEDTLGDDSIDPREPETGDDPTPKSSKQPLVGYWLWENSLRSHKMKLHLAKRSDLVLHVVLAIIANQVRYERNAVAMTI